MRNKFKMFQVICLFILSGLLLVLGSFVGKIAYGKYQVLRKIQKDEAELTKAKSTSLPNFNIGLEPEHTFTKYRLPLKKYTLQIVNSNKDSAPVFDFRIKFTFERNVTETGQKIIIPREGMTVGGIERLDRKKDGTQSFYEDQPVEPDIKYYSLQIEKVKINGNVTNTNFVVFNCEKWPKRALYLGKIVVDLSTKPQPLLIEADSIGKYKGEYKYEIMGKIFSEKVEGRIPSPDDKSGIKDQ